MANIHGTDGRVQPPGDSGEGTRHALGPSWKRARGTAIRYSLAAMPNSLLVVHVDVHVKPAAVEAFLRATRENAEQSLREPGVARFDVVQDEQDATRFVLVEAYRHAGAPAAHKETAHYRIWRDAVADMMAEPRSSRRFRSVFPEDERW